jgi:hypothetical protein
MNIKKIAGLKDSKRLKTGYQVIGGLLSLLLVTACSNTKLSQTWSDPDFKGSYQDIMVVGISDSEQLRRAYETYFADHLRERGVESIASYKLIDHKTEQEITEDTKNNLREIVNKAIQGSDVDAVLITHLVAINEEDIYRPSMDYQPAYGPMYYSEGYYGDMYGYHGYVTTYVMQPGYFTEEYTYVLETNLYDAKTDELMWTTRSKTFAPESMDEAIQELSGLIIDDLVSRKIIK